MTGWGCRRTGILLPLFLGAQCFRQDNLANELVNGPLVTLRASPKPIWEIPLKAQSLLVLPPAGCRCRRLRPGDLGPLH